MKEELDKWFLELWDDLQGIMKHVISKNPTFIVDDFQEVFNSVYLSMAKSKIVMESKDHVKHSFTSHLKYEIMRVTNTAYNAKTKIKYKSRETPYGSGFTYINTPDNLSLIHI